MGLGGGSGSGAPFGTCVGNTYSMPVPKIQRRSRGSDKSDADADSAATSKRVKRSYTYEQKCSATRRNLKCGCCQKPDTVMDPVDPTNRILWFEFVFNQIADNLETSGPICYYCARVHNAKFSHLGLKKWRADLADPKCAETHDTYSRYLTWLIDQLIDDFNKTGIILILPWSPFEGVCLTTS